MPDQTAFADAPFWIDDDPARALRDGFARAGVEAWATGAGVRDVAIARSRAGGPSPFAPPVVEVLAAGTHDDAARAAAASGLRARAARDGIAIAGGRTRFVVRPMGRGSPRALLDADAGRRDFTANAIRCRLDGRVEDPLGGAGDIAARRVRLAHPAALRDDPVRVIRLARMRILVGEAEPDPEAEGEARAYGSEAAGCDQTRVLAELARLVACGPADRVAAEVIRLEALGALDGLALAPRADRLGRFLAIAEGAGLRADPWLAIGALTAARTARGAWTNGIRAGLGDARDAAIARASILLGTPPGPADPPAAGALREAAA